MLAEDRIILRELAQRYAEKAFMDSMREREGRCKRHNGLEIVRPLINIFEVPWGELKADDELILRCTEPHARALENRLRQVLFQMKYFPVDLMLPPYFEVYPSINGIGFGIDIEEKTEKSQTGSNIMSHQYSDVIPDIESLEKVKMPHLSIDQANTAQDMEVAQTAFDGLMEIRQGGVTLYHAMWDVIPMLHGANKTIMDLIDRPEYCHAAVSKFTDYYLALHAEYERLNVLAAHPYYLHATPALTDELPAKDFDGKHVRLKDVWARGMAQIFSSVSPKMHDEFDLAYMQKIFDQCGLSYYGCCEPLDTKIDILRKRFKNLRKISISPWADPVRAAENIHGDYVLSCKPNPSAVAVKTNVEAVKQDIEKVCKACLRTGTPCEFILKDISTISGNVDNLRQWADAAQEVVNKYY